MTINPKNRMDCPQCGETVGQDEDEDDDEEDDDDEDEE